MDHLLGENAPSGVIYSVVGIGRVPKPLIDSSQIIIGLEDEQKFTFDHVQNLNDVFVVVDGVIFYGLLGFCGILFTESSLEVLFLAFVHHIFVCPVNDHGCEKLIKVGSQFLRSLLNPFLVL